MTKLKTGCPEVTMSQQCDNFKMEQDLLWGQQLMAYSTKPCVA